MIVINRIAIKLEERDIVKGKVRIPESVMCLGTGFAVYNDELEEIIIPKNIYVQNSFLLGCCNLKKIKIY